ncbi:hypothetical protein ACQY0O_004409 [Thecaphora frezii]
MALVLPWLQEESGYYVCGVCNLRTADPTLLQAHLETSPAHGFCSSCGQDYGANPLDGCPSCSRRSTRFMCDFCGNVVRPTEFEWHCRTRHSICDACNGYCPDDDELRLHQAQDHADSYCQKCRHLYRDAEELSRHREDRHRLAVRSSSQRGEAPRPPRNEQPRSHSQKEPDTDRGRSNSSNSSSSSNRPPKRRRDGQGMLICPFDCCSKRCENIAALTQHLPKCSAHLSVAEVVTFAVVADCNNVLPYLSPTLRESILKQQPSSLDLSSRNGSAFPRWRPFVPKLPASARPFRCKSCRKDFVSISALLQHMKDAPNCRNEQTAVVWEEFVFEYLPSAPRMLRG